MSNNKATPHQHDHTALKVSFWLSALCLIHCIAFPILIVLMPFFNTVFEISHTLEWILLGGTFTIGMYSLWHGYKLHHHDLKPMLLFIVGLIVNGGAHISGAHSQGWLLTIVSILGAFMIAGSQYYNLKLTKSNACTTPH